MTEKTDLQRRQLLAATIAFALPSISTAQSVAVMPQPAFPSYRFIVGFGAGGVPDAASRVIAAKISERWKIPALVENKLGAGGMLAAQAVLAAPPDAMTILSITPAHATAPAIYKKVPYDSLKDFSPVTLIGEGPAIIVVPNDSKFKTLADLVQYAKANPGKLSYSSAGVGSSSHFATALMCQQASIDALNIPYKSIGEALTETMAGRVDFHIAPYVSAIKLVKSGKLRALAGTGLKRLVDLPEVPTASESGVSGYEWNFWYGFLVSSKTPASQIDLLHRDLTNILRLPDVSKHIQEMGVNISSKSPEEFKKLLESEVLKYARIAKIANIQPE